MRAGFVTCVQLGRRCIEAILQTGGRLDCLLTLHDHVAPAKSGRIYLDDLASSHALPLFKVRNINDADAVELIRSRGLDWLFIIGWSQIAKADVLESTKHGVLGMHPTLLPIGRGRAAIPWAILKGLRETGVTLFKLDHGVDSGPIVAQERLPIGPRETATTLYERVAAAHVELIRKSWPLLVSGELVATPQDDSRATYWPGRRPDDGRLDLSMTVADADAMVRATTHPYPGAFIDMPEGRLRIWSGAPEEPQMRGTPRLRSLEFADGNYWVQVADLEPSVSAS